MIQRFLFIHLILLLFFTGCNPDPPAAPSPAPGSSEIPPSLTTPTQTAIPTKTITPFPSPTTPTRTVPITVSPTPILLPPIGRGSSFAYDRERGEVLAFGGSLSGKPEPGNETWAWDGHAWKQYHPQNAPPARLNAAMVYDPARRQIVLFGGAQLDGQFLGDMWLWDGGNWIENKPPQLPAPRAQALMVYDEARNEIFMFGGYSFDKDANFNYFSETWTFDGQTWTNKNPAHSPRAGDGVPQPIMTYDAARKQAILLEFGAGTWIWNGNDWNQVEGTGESPLSIEGRLSYDEKNQVVLLWGHDISKTHEFPPETWLFDGQTWIKANVQEPGPYSPEVSLLYDSRQQKILMLAFIGEKVVQPSLLVWEWSASGWQKTFPP